MLCFQLNLSKSWLFIQTGPFPSLASSPRLKLIYSHLQSQSNFVWLEKLIVGIFGHPCSCVQMSRITNRTQTMNETSSCVIAQELLNERVGNSWPAVCQHKRLRDSQSFPLTWLWTYSANVAMSWGWYPMKSRQLQPCLYFVFCLADWAQLFGAQSVNPSLTPTSLIPLAQLCTVTLHSSHGPRCSNRRPDIRVLELET